MLLNRHILALTLAIPFGVAGVGCSDSGGVHTIDTTRTATKPHAPAKPGMDSAERFGFKPAPQAATAAAPAPLPFQWETPPGWQILAPQPMRDLNFAVGDPPSTECFLSVLSSSGGGLAANVNRWRQQMGLAPESADVIDALPPIQVLGLQGTLVELEGTYSGMRGDQNAENSKLLAAFVPAGGQTLTIKMIGPAEQVNAERESFLSFVSSLAVSDPRDTARADAPDQDDSHAHADAGEDSGDMLHESVGGLSFEVPRDWERTGERPMRLVTYTLGAKGETECYISPLSGAGGGTDANLNRWLNQMGQPPMDAAAIAALPTLSVLGQDVPLLQTVGTYTSMRGETNVDYSLAGVFVPLDGTSYSIKLIGPQADVAANRAAFIAFCESLHVH